MSDTPHPYNHAELQEFSRAVVAHAYELMGDAAAPSAASVMAVACANLFCTIYGPGGLERLRNQIDICERQIMGGAQ